MGGKHSPPPSLAGTAGGEVVGAGCGGLVRHGAPGGGGESAPAGSEEVAAATPGTLGPEGEYMCLTPDWPGLVHAINENWCKVAGIIHEGTVCFDSLAGLMQPVQVAHMLAGLSSRTTKSVAPITIKQQEIQSSAQYVFSKAAL